MIYRLTAVAASMLVMGAAPAYARISGPSPVSPRGVLVQGSDVAAGGGRSALLIAGYRHARGHPLEFSLYARLGRGTQFGPWQRLAGQTLGEQVAVGADGTAVAAWMDRTHRGSSIIRVVVATPGKPFGRVQTLSRARSLSLGGIAVTATGRVLVAWRRGTSGVPVQASIRAPGHRFGAPRTLGKSRQNTPAVTAAPDGTLVVAWLDTPSPPPPPPAPYVPKPALVLAASLGSADSTFKPAVQLASLSFWYSGPEAASGPGGAAIIWRQTPIEKRVVSVAPAGVFQAAEALAIPSPPAGEGQSDHLALGIPAGGPAIALWHEVGGTPGDVFKVTSSIVNASLRPSGGVFQPAIKLSHDGVLAGQPHAAAANDRVLAAWSETSRAAGARVCIVIRAKTKAADESRCLRPAAGTDTGSVNVAAAKGYGLVTWIEHAPVSSPGGRLYLASYRR